MYIDDFRSAMKKIVKQPNDRGFMKMDEEISNFSSDGNVSDDDGREIDFGRQTETAGFSPS